MSKPLTREQVKAVIEGRGAAQRVPMIYRFWINPAIFKEREQEATDLLITYPDDVASYGIVMPGVYATEGDNGYSYVRKQEPKSDEKKGLDSNEAIADWDELDDVLANFPSPEFAGMFPVKPENDGRYVLCNWWYCFFERMWSLRGMENALMDFYTNPDEVHRLFDALTNFYCRVIERAAKEMHANGVFTSDDIGTQNSPFFSPEIFRTFFKPYYKRLIDTAHANDMHFWLHTCGNIEEFIPDFIEIGLDVLHPIQKYTMDEKKIAEKYGDKICIWAGFDVQQTIPYGTPEDVQKEIRYLIDTYYRKDGRFMLTLGNGATPDTPFDSLKMLLEETVSYSLRRACAPDSRQA